MAEKDRPQITLITPPAYDWESFPDTLARVLDTVEVACLRLPLAGQDEFDLGPHGRCRAPGRPCA
ncbi:hypothetical protein MASR1M32_33060 [Rhodobacter sp.]